MPNIVPTWVRGQATRWPIFFNPVKCSTRVVDIINNQNKLFEIEQWLLTQPKIKYPKIDKDNAFEIWNNLLINNESEISHRHTFFQLKHFVIGKEI